MISAGLTLEMRLIETTVDVCVSVLVTVMVFRPVMIGLDEVREMAGVLVESTR
jgi:hypothetical protein